MDFNLTAQEKETLLITARNRIRDDLGLEKTTVPEPSEKLSNKYGAFVTLHKKKALRGCIGHMQGVEPLIDTISDMAHAAAFQDPRFPPLRRDEEKDVHIEITVLSPLQEISDIDEIQVGTHGLYIQKGPRTGVLLPQVAVEQDWDRTTFLMHTCYKAGLSPEEWKQPDTKIFIFSGLIFSEQETE
ncbi:MAG: AmmeMemoRadiSam system protein A [Spirochaetia bacterium]